MHFKGSLLWPFPDLVNCFCSSLNNKKGLFCRTFLSLSLWRLFCHSFHLLYLLHPWLTPFWLTSCSSLTAIASQRGILAFGRESDRTKHFEMPLVVIGHRTKKGWVEVEDGFWVSCSIAQRLNVTTIIRSACDIERPPKSKRLVLGCVNQ